MKQLIEKQRVWLYAALGVGVLLLAAIAYFFTNGRLLTSNLIQATGYPVSVGTVESQVTVGPNQSFTVNLKATGATTARPLKGVKLTLDLPSSLTGSTPTFSAAPGVSVQGTPRLVSGNKFVVLMTTSITNADAPLGTLTFQTGATVTNNTQVSTFNQTGTLLVSEISGTDGVDPNSFVTFNVPNGVLFNLVAGSGGNNQNTNSGGNTGPFTITHRVVSGQGTINPASPITVNGGDSVTLVITPGTCNVLTSLTDNGVNTMNRVSPVAALVAGNSFNYTLGNIDQNHEVLVSFGTDPACGNGNVNAGNNNLNGLNAPVITAINPTSGPTGTTVTLTGINFSTTGNTVRLTNDGTGATTNIVPSAQNTTSITFTVPAGLPVGPYTVTVENANNLTSNGVAFTITTGGGGNNNNQNGNNGNTNQNNGNGNGTFTIVLNPTQGPVGTPVTISTPGGFPNGSTSTVTFTCPNNTSATIQVTASNGTLDFNVPGGLAQGTCTVTVTNGNGTGSGTFTITAGGNGNQNNGNGSLGAVTLTNINPSNTNSGQTITLTGTGFGTAAGQTNTVVFVPTGYCPGQTTVTSAGNASSATSMTTVVPSLRDCTYNVFVQVSNGTQTVNSNTLPITIGSGSSNGNGNGNGNPSNTSVGITRLDPIQGPVTTALDIYGFGFGTTNNNTVFFVPGGNCPASQTTVAVNNVDSTGTFIDNLDIPDTLAVCTYSVYLSTGGVNSNPAKFNVTAAGTNPVQPATISNVQPNPSPQGGPLTITGTGFNPVNTVTITCGAQTATLTNVLSNGNEIRITLPANLVGSCTVVVDNGNGPSNAFPFVITAGNANQNGNNNNTNGGNGGNNNNNNGGPNVPQNVRAFGDPQSNQVIVIWDPVTNATGYNIFRINDGQTCAQGQQVGSVGAQNTFTYNEGTPGTYRYCVSAIVAGTESGRGGPSNAVTVGTNMNGFVDGGINPGFLILPLNSITGIPLTADNNIPGNTITWTFRGFNRDGTVNNGLVTVTPTTGRTTTVKPVFVTANENGGVVFVTATGDNGTFSTIPVIVWRRGDTDGDFVTGPVDQNNVVRGWNY